MSAPIQNQAKIALRQQITKVLKGMSTENKKKQSDEITKKKTKFCTERMKHVDYLGVKPESILVESHNGIRIPKLLFWQIEYSKYVGYFEGVKFVQHEMNLEVYIVIAHPVYKRSKRISIYLSTNNEVNTIDILKDMLVQNKQIFVPAYHLNEMKMVKIMDMEDYDNLPLTKWNIKQPRFDELRENPMETGGLDLIILPGMAFTMSGGRLGHGRGYYDKYLKELFELYPNKSLELSEKRTTLMGLGFREQILQQNNLPLDAHDYPLDLIITID